MANHIGGGCPQCFKGKLEQVVQYSTACCGITTGKSAVAVCPECGRVRPDVVESDRFYQCHKCGYVERSPTVV
jgi:uncharacterized Zn finger protein